MKSFLLGKLLYTNTDYETEDDTFLVIQEVGSEDTAKVTLKVDGIPVAELLEDIAPLFKYATHFLPLLKLEDLFVVVPPNKILRIQGTDGKTVRIKGFLNKLAPGEALPAAFAGRYTEQGQKYFSYKKTVLAAETACGAGSAIDILTFECPAGQKWLFDNLLMFEGWSTVEHDYGITARLVLQDSAFDNLVNAKLLLGISQREIPYPPDSSRGYQYMTLKDRPIEVAPGQIFKIQAVNTTDAALAIKETVTKALIVGKKEYLKP